MFGTTSTLIEDFNKDGYLDLFFNHKIHLNNKNGGFYSASNIFPLNGGGVAAADFDDDSILDLVFADPGGGNMLFYKGNGMGYFFLVLSKPVVTHTVLAYDFNGDGRVDIIGQGYGGELIILFNDSNGSFANRMTIETGNTFYSVLLIRDIDNDGSDDLILSNDEDILYRAIHDDGTLGPVMHFEVGTGPIRSVAFANVFGSSSLG